MCILSLVNHTFFRLMLAMLKKPVVTEVRTPTNTWSGLGFSKSMPAETIKELRRANHVSYKPSMATTYEVRCQEIWTDRPCALIMRVILSIRLWCVFKGSPLALSRSSSREGMASGSDSDNWRERNGSGLPAHPDFTSPISPKRKQNRTGESLPWSARKSKMPDLHFMITFQWCRSHLRLVK